VADPADRRASLVAATLPLLRDHGLAVHTRQIAQAAGVAEGTIFTVFPDKSALIQAAVLSAFDPTPIVASIAEIDPAADLRRRLLAVVDIIAQRLTENEPLVTMIRGLPSTPENTSAFLAHLGRSRQHIVDAVATVIEPDRAALRRSPNAVARLLVPMVFAVTRGTFGLGADMGIEEIVTLLLDGLLVRPPDPGADT
jgi:AcrR family transcriptional regulator